MAIPLHSKLCVSVFGACTITLDDYSFIENSRSAEWLLTLLILRHDQTITYEEIEHCLWGKPLIREQGERCSHVSAAMSHFFPDGGIEKCGGLDLRGKQNWQRRDAACRCKPLYANELLQGTAREEPHCVRLRLITRDGKEVLRLCNPTKSSLRLKLSLEAEVDLWDFDANRNSNDRAVLLRLEALCRPDMLLRGCETKWAEEQRQHYREKYAVLRKRLFDGASALPVPPPSEPASPGEPAAASENLVFPVASTHAPTQITGSLPPLPPLMLGREEALGDLKRQLIVAVPQSTEFNTPSRTQVITAVRGWPGVGKTTLAAALAHDAEIHAAFSDGILWTSLGTEPDILSLLTTWGNQLQPDALRYVKNANEASEVLRTLLRNKRMLLIVDDVWQQEHAQAFRVGGVGCATLFTTRESRIAHSLAPRAQDVYVLPVLTNDAALHLLQMLAPVVVAQNEAACRELCHELEGLPLALQVAGRLLHEEHYLGFDVDALLQSLRDGVQVLAATAPANRADLVAETTPTVAALLQKSTDRLDAQTRDCFALLGPFAPKPAAFDLDALKSVWQMSDPRPVVKTLASRGLLEPVGEGRFQMHALLVSHACSLLEE